MQARPATHDGPRLRQWRPGAAPMSQPMRQQESATGFGLWRVPLQLVQEQRQPDHASGSQSLRWLWDTCPPAAPPGARLVQASCAGGPAPRRRPHTPRSVQLRGDDTGCEDRARPEPPAGGGADRVLEHGKGQEGSSPLGRKLQTRRPARSVKARPPWRQGSGKVRTGRGKGHRPAAGRRAPRTSPRFGGTRHRVPDPGDRLCSNDRLTLRHPSSLLLLAAWSRETC